MFNSRRVNRKLLWSLGIKVLHQCPFFNTLVPLLDKYIPWYVKYILNQHNKLFTLYFENQAFWAMFLLEVLHFQYHSQSFRDTLYINKFNNRLRFYSQKLQAYFFPTTWTFHLENAVDSIPTKLYLGRQHISCQFATFRETSRLLQKLLEKLYDRTSSTFSQTLRYLYEHISNVRFSLLVTVSTYTEIILLPGKFRESALEGVAKARNLLRTWCGLSRSWHRREN